MEHMCRQFGKELGILGSSNSGEDQDSTSDNLDVDSMSMSGPVEFFRVSIGSLNKGSLLLICGSS